MFDDTVPVLFQCGSNLCRLSLQNFAPNHNHHIAWRQAVLVLAKTFPKQSFQTITSDRFGHLLAGYRKSEARAFTGLFADQNGDACVAASNIVLKYLTEIARSRKSQLSWKRLAGRPGHVTA